MIAGAIRAIVGGARLLFYLLELGGQLFIIVIAEFVDNDRSKVYAGIITLDTHIISFMYMEPIHDLFWYGKLFVTGNAPKHTMLPSLEYNF